MFRPLFPRLRGVSPYELARLQLQQRDCPRFLRSYASSSAPRPVFDWQDPLASKNLLTEEEIAISETAERYCQEQLLPRVLRESQPLVTTHIGDVME